MTRVTTATLLLLPLTLSAAEPVRLVVPLRGGPLLLDLYLTLDGRPYEAGRNELVDEMLTLADEDGDGVPTWGEAVLNPRFPFNLSRQRQLVQQFDGNRDTRMDREEAKALLERYGGGPALNVSARSPAAFNASILSLLDVDDDEVLSAEELATAAVRLRVHDLDDDGLLAATEVLGQRQQTYTPGQRILRRPNGQSTMAGTSFVWNAENGTNLAREILSRRYGAGHRVPKAAWPTHTDLFDALDTDGNAVLENEEFAGLRTADAHLTVSVAIGNTEAGPVGVQVTGVSDPVERDGVRLEDRSQSVRLERARTGIVLQAAPDRASPDYSQTAANVLRLGDTDKNGYLESDELEKSRSQQYLVQRFDEFDADMDSKIFPEEIEAFYERQQAPRNTQVTIVVSELQPTLFDGLDVDGDRRLSVRELRNLPSRFAELDVNGDGRIGPDELPGETTLSFGRSSLANFQRLTPPNGPNASTFRGGGVRTGGPKWFVAMDVNGDGDVTPREFVGTAEQFGTLDTNEDGFVDADEARAATASR